MNSKPVRPFKSTIDLDESKRRREENTVSLRRQVRNEHFTKRRIGNDRQVTIEPILSANSLLPPTGELTEEEIKRQADLAEKLKSLPQYLADIQSDDLQRQFNGTQLIRKILSIGLCAQSFVIIRSSRLQSDPLQLKLFFKPISSLVSCNFLDSIISQSCNSKHVGR